MRGSHRGVQLRAGSKVPLWIPRSPLRLARILQSGQARPQGHQQEGCYGNREQDGGRQRVHVGEV